MENAEMKIVKYRQAIRLLMVLFTLHFSLPLVITVLRS